jgi:hypothetical protein
MYSSVQAGVSALDSGRRFFLLPVDCPLVRAETIGRLARRAATAGADVVVPVHRGVRGHPPLLAAAFRDEILAADQPGGLLDLLEAHSGGMLEVDVPDPGTALDADTQEELTTLRAAAAGEDLPSEARCLTLLRESGASDDLVAHSNAVASVAAALVTALNERQQYLCVPLVVAGALLHDVARSQPHHAEAGARVVEGLGYGRLAPLVRHHMRLGDAAADELDETQVVYLADKIVQGDRLVGPEKRFEERLERFATDPAARAGVLARREETRRVLGRVEAVLGRPLGGMAGG